MGLVGAGRHNAMRIILDANQARNIPHANANELVLAPYVLAEILLHPKGPAPFLEKLSRINPKIGLEPAAALDAVANLSESEIYRFEPFSSKSRFVFSAQALDQAKQLARQTKDQHFRFCGSMFERAKEFRRGLAGRDTVRFRSMTEAMSSLPSLREMVVDWVRNGGKRNCAISDQNDLYEAVMRNQYLSNFFRTILYYVISFSRAWADQANNFDPSDARDDWTDITLPLYGSTGDFILTADTKLQSAVAMIGSHGTLLAGTSIPSTSLPPGTNHLTSHFSALVD